ncbi:LAME_0D07888g1_1 [Lachancea meyersii CBS 8951]|uniref:LAME_0D07888g1_1 n=1 Tax=Lachancea meyersii CBS 8951 TaxID=1266667 RepID=A0A1G4JA12_9SACH|nr:LAME_0D07888g1_1 [Lachancea meyersii CBS 8951]
MSSSPKITGSEESDNIMTEHVSFYTPIGHAGLPLPHDYFHGASYEIPKSATPEAFPMDYNVCTTDSASKLPIEIKIRISNLLSQYDLVNLARTSKQFCAVAMQALFSKIVVDSRHSYLQGAHQTVKNRVTYVKTRYNFARLMRLISENGENLGSLIKCFEIINLPDGMSKSEIRTLMCTSLPVMGNLCKFYCGSDTLSLPPKMLQLMPNKRGVETLAVNVDLRHGCEPIDTFANVQKLSINPFVDSGRLAGFLSKILVPTVVENLTTLCVARECTSVLSRPSNESLIVTGFMLNNNLEQPDSAESDEVVKFNQRDLGFWRFLDSVSSRDGKFENLGNLEVSGVSVVPEDCLRVVDGINLGAIKLLALSDVQEVQVIREVDYEVTDFRSLALEHMQSSFLGGLSPFLQNLRKLRLDYREPIKDSVHEFLRSLKEDAGVSLQELDLSIHWDDSKLALWPSWQALAQKYMTSILLHAQTLRKLSLVAFHDYKFYELPKRIPSEVLIQLQQCRALKSLRLHGESLHPVGANLIAQFTGLETLDLVGKASGGPQHMALQAVHAGVLDRWYRVIHVAIALSRSNPALKHVRIDRCLFECLSNGTVGPQTDDQGFDAITRVLMSVQDWEKE